MDTELVSLPHVSEIRARPAATPVTSPSSTVATAASEVSHVAGVSQVLRS